MEDNVDYSLLRHWRAQRWPALYAAAAEAHEDEFENRVADLATRLDARRAAGQALERRLADRPGRPLAWQR